MRINSIQSYYSNTVKQNNNHKKTSNFVQNSDVFFRSVGSIAVKETARNFQQEARLLFMNPKYETSFKTFRRIFLVQQKMGIIPFCFLRNFTFSIVIYSSLEKKKLTRFYGIIHIIFGKIHCCTFGHCPEEQIIIKILIIFSDHLLQVIGIC